MNHPIVKASPENNAPIKKPSANSSNISSKLNKADELFMEYEGNKKISDLKK